MAPPSKQKKRLAFASAVGALLLVAALAYHALAVSRRNESSVQHSHEVLDTLAGLLLAMQSVEASAGGFVLTGDDSYLQSYPESLASAAQARSELRRLTLDNPEQQRHLPALESLIDLRLERAETIIRLRRDQGLAAAANAIQSAPGLRLPAELQAVVGELREAELRLLVLREAEAGQSASQTNSVLLLVMALISLIAAAAWSARRHGAGRLLAKAALQDSEDTYRSLIDGVQDHAIFMLDPLGHVLSWNAGAERIKGYTAEQIIGQSYACFFTAEDIERGLPAHVLKMAAANGRYQGEAVRVRRDGSRFSAQVTFTALRDAAGVLKGFSESSHDLSESQASEARYRGLLEAAPDAMVIADKDGRIVLVNGRAEALFGYGREELVGQLVEIFLPNCYRTTHPAHRESYVADAKARRMAVGLELRARRKDGSEFPVEISLAPLESADGILVTAAIRDISVRKAADRHLAQMESRYRGLLEAAPDAMVIADQDGRIVLVSGRTEALFGYARDELVGQLVEVFLPGRYRATHPGHREGYVANAKARRMGVGLELHARRKDGSEFPVEISLAPLETAEGILVTAAIRDISVRKAADRHLVQMEARYRGLLEAAPDAMVVVDQGGEIVLLNVQAEKQFGYRRDELLGQKVTNIIPEGFAERLIADALRPAEEALAQHIGGGLELSGRRKSGSQFPIEIMLSPLESSDGMLVTAAIRDITTRKKAEAHLKAEAMLLEKVGELNRSNEELAQFAYVASHDLQEPLRMVASYTQLLSRRYKGKLDADADEFIAFAVDGAQRMQRLIQDVLAYSRLGTKREELVATSSERALAQALMNLAGAIEESGARVTHEPLPSVIGDELQLIQLFQNLVGNGIKYRSAGVPTVHVSATRHGAKDWTFAVKDNGLGIDPQYFERIFGMFQRLHKREEFGGTGIGLAICKKIVERHGSSISVKSGLGLGSTFSFDLAGAALSC